MPLLAMLLLAMLQFAALLPGQFDVGTDTLRAADTPTRVASALHHADGYRLAEPGRVDTSPPDLVLPPLGHLPERAAAPAPSCAALRVASWRRHVSAYLACGPPALSA